MTIAKKIPSSPLKKKIMTGPDLDYDFTKVRNWKKIHMKSYEILFLKKIFGKISVDAWDWANDLKSYDTTVKNVS